MRDLFVAWRGLPRSLSVLQLPWTVAGPDPMTLGSRRIAVARAGLDQLRQHAFHARKLGQAVPEIRQMTIDDLVDLGARSAAMHLSFQLARRQSP